MSESRRIRILVADDHVLFRRGLVRLLDAEPDFEVVGEATDGWEALDRAASCRPDVVLMDVRMPQAGGLDAARRLREMRPEVKVVMLSLSEDDQDIFDAIRVGARGYLLKTIEPQELIDAVRQVLRGEAVLSGGLAGRILREFARQAERPAGTEDPPARLSHREEEVLALITEGRSNKEIAVVLDLAESAVKNHVKQILAKLHLQNRVQAAIYASAAGRTGGPVAMSPSPARSAISA